MPPSECVISSKPWCCGRRCRTRTSRSCDKPTSPSTGPGLGSEDAYRIVPSCSIRGRMARSARTSWSHCHHGIDEVMRHLAAAQESVDYDPFELLEVLDAGPALRGGPGTASAAVAERAAQLRPTRVSRGPPGPPGSCMGNNRFFVPPDVPRTLKLRSTIGFTGLNGTGSKTEQFGSSRVRECSRVERPRRERRDSRPFPTRTMRGVMPPTSQRRLLPEQGGTRRSRAHRRGRWALSPASRSDLEIAGLDELRQSPQARSLRSHPWGSETPAAGRSVAIAS